MYLLASEFVCWLLAVAEWPKSIAGSTMELGVFLDYLQSGCIASVIPFSSFFYPLLFIRLEFFVRRLD